MKIVIDTNRIIASLIKNSYSKSIIYDNKFEFFTPQYATEEIYKYKNEILQKSEMTEEEFNSLFSVLFEKIKSKTYYYIVEGKLDKRGKVKQKVILYLGNIDNIIRIFNFYKEHN